MKSKLQSKVFAECQYIFKAYKIFTIYFGKLKNFQEGVERQTAL